MQTCPLPQASPQPPQFELLVAVSVQPIPGQQTLLTLLSAKSQKP
jgi:hypothetical protein